MPSTALVLTGHLRTFDRAWPSMKKHVIDPYEPDVFGFIWSESMGLHKHVPDVNDPSFALGYDPNSGGIPQDYIDHVRESVRPKSLALLDQNQVISEIDQMVDDYASCEPDERLLLPLSPRAKFCMVYSKQKALYLKKQYEKDMGFIYDRVILARWDVAPHSAIDLDAFPTDTVVIPKEYSFGGFCDVWAQGPSAMIDRTGDLLRTLPILRARIDGFTTHQHRWLQDQLNYYQVPHIIANLPIRIYR